MTFKRVLLFSAVYGYLFASGNNEGDETCLAPNDKEGLYFSEGGW